MSVLLIEEPKFETDISIFSLASVASLREHATPHRFEVPEDVNDSSSAPSREGSVQILDSHPRTFSVPSSDGESDSMDDDSEVEIASSVQGNNEKDSAATTPENGPPRKESILVDLDPEDSDEAASQHKVRGLNLQGPSLVKVLSKQPAITGRSQLNPIDLDGDNARKHDMPDSESEDEGPEILPIQQPLAKAAKSPLWKPEDAAVPIKPLKVANVEMDLYDEDHINRTILEARERLSKGKGKGTERYQSPELHPESVAGSTDGFDSADDDGLDHDDDFSDLGLEDDNLDSFGNSVMSTAGPKVPQAPKPQVPFAVKISQPAYQIPSIRNHSMGTGGACKSGGFNVSMSNAVDVSQPHYLGFPPTVIPRAPSPSDAALARYPSGSGAMDSYSGLGPMFRNPKTNVGLSQNIAHEVPNIAPFSYYPYPQFADPNIHSKPYEQGPFCNREQSNVPESGDPFTFEDALYESTLNHSLEQVRADTTLCTRANDVDDDARYAAQLQAEEDTYASAVRISARGDHHAPLGTESRKAGEGQSSKINISSLMNDSYADQSRPLKRKSEAISTDFGDDEDDAPLATKAANKSDTLPQFVIQQETQLPDAQARDVLDPVETASLTQDSTLDSTVSSIPISSVGEAVEAEGPARKKAKTTSSARGIGTFVSGVCVGLAGVLAAFVATIPASVREEALRELGNAA